MTPAEVEAILERQSQQLDDLEHTVADLLTSQSKAGSAVPDEPAAPFQWSSLPEFVEHVIAPLYAAHLVSGSGWCQQWYAHVEARIRLGAVWRAWETLRLDPHVGMARWLRDVADPQMDRAAGTERPVPGLWRPAPSSGPTAVTPGPGHILG